MLVSQRIPNLLGGVSQRPPTERPLNSVSDGLNVLGSPSKGLHTRPGTGHRARLSDTPGYLDGAQFFPILRDSAGTRRTLAISGTTASIYGRALIYDEDTGERFVVGYNPGDPDALPFLQSPSGYSAVTVGTTTFLANRSITVETVAPFGSPSDQTFYERQAHLFVKATEYSTLYSVTVDATTVTYTTAATGDVSPTATAEALKVALAAALGAPWFVSRNGSTVTLYKNDRSDFTISGQDSLSNEGMAVIKGYVESLEDLPEKAEYFTTLKVRGAVGTDKDDMWVRFSDPDHVTEKAIWYETGDPAAVGLYNPSTLPWQIQPAAVYRSDLTVTSGGSGLSADVDATFVISEIVGKYLVNVTDGSFGPITSFAAGSTITVASLQGGTANVLNTGDVLRITNGPGDYTLSQVNWGDRGAGSDESAPVASFVGKRIQALFFYKNRLGFLADETVNLSASGDLLRFWRRTMTDLLADDPIDVTSAFPGIAPLDGSVEWNGRLVIHSRAGHLFALSGEPALTPASVRLDHLMALGATQDCTPVVVGSRLYVPRKSGSYTLLSEVFYDDEDDGVLDHGDLSIEAPKLATGVPQTLAGSSGAGLVALLTDAADYGYLYIYQEEWAGTERRWSAWHTWRLGDPGERVLHVGITEDLMTLVVRRSDGVFIETIGLTAEHSTLTPPEDRVGYTTTRPFTSFITPNPLYLRDRTGAPQTEGRLQLRYVSLEMQNTDRVLVNVTPEGGLRSKSILLKDGAKRFPVLTRNTVSISIMSTALSGFSISSLEWEGYFTKRNQSA